MRPQDRYWKRELILAVICSYYKINNLTSADHIFFYYFDFYLSYICLLMPTFFIEIQARHTALNNGR